MNMCDKIPDPKGANRFIIKDSGERQEFESGMVRDSQEGRSRPDLISPFFEDRLGIHLARGAKKYNERNWEKGAKFSRFWASLNRHVMLQGQGDRSEDHLAAIVFNAMGIMHFEELGRTDLDDMPKYEKCEAQSVVDRDTSKAVRENAKRLSIAARNKLLKIQRDELNRIILKEIQKALRRADPERDIEKRHKEIWKGAKAAT